MQLALPTVLFGFALSPFALVLSSSAQTACVPDALPKAAAAVATIRRGLHGVAVGELDPVVPAPVAAQLGRLKDALEAAGNAAVACSPPNSTAEALQGVLARALRANLADAAEGVSVTTEGKELGAYGSDLQVQVLPLSSAPRTLEIDFRYGIECGDDNLLLVYRQASAPDSRWRKVLRWDAPGYTEVSDAFGDFVLLTPLPGTVGQSNWRAVVAHGRPGCSTTEGSSQFDLDILQPDPEPGTDPARPEVVWHLEQPYARLAKPRLATTEDSLTFELLAPQPQTQTPKSVARKPAGSQINPSAPQPVQIYRYRVTADSRVQAIAGAPEGTPHTAQ